MPFLRDRRPCPPPAGQTSFALRFTYDVPVFTTITGSILRGTFERRAGSIQSAWRLPHPDPSVHGQEPRGTPLQVACRPRTMADLAWPISG